MKFYHVVATANNGVIGHNNTIPWQSREDMSFFRRMTMNSIIVMGRKTYESLHRKLTNRHIVVLTRTPDILSLDSANLMGDTVVVSSDLDTGIAEILNQLQDRPEIQRERVYIVGGEEIYNLTAERVCASYVSNIDVHVEGDAFYKVPHHLTTSTIHETQLSNVEDPFRSYTVYESDIEG